MEGLHESGNRARAEKIDEAVSNIASVLEIDRQIEEVISAGVLLVHLFQQHLLCVFVWDIPNLHGDAQQRTITGFSKKDTYHNCSSLFCTSENPIDVQAEVVLMPISLRIVSRWSPCKPSKLTVRQIERILPIYLVEMKITSLLS